MNLLDGGIGAAINTGMTAIAKTLNLIRDYGTSYYKDSTLADASKLARVEPITIISQRLLHNPVISDVNNALLSLFTGYYLQAVNLSTSIEDVEVVRILDKLNPDRDETAFLMSERKLSREQFNWGSAQNYCYRLPTRTRPSLEAINEHDNERDVDDLRKQWGVGEDLENENSFDEKAANNREQLNIDQNKLDLEWQKLKLEREKAGAQHSQHSDKLKTEYAKINQQAEQNRLARDKLDLERNRPDYEKKKAELEEAKLGIERQKLDLIRSEYREKGAATEIKELDLQTLANMSIGRLINVKIPYTKKLESGHNENRFVTIPINIRLLVSTLPSQTIVNILSYKGQDMNFIERIHGARSGALSWIADLILCQDVIDEYKRTAILDEKNTLMQIAARSASAKKWGLVTRNPSLAAASTLIVITDAEAKEIEYKLGGKLENPNVRQKAFEGTYSMIIVVVSEEWETVTFHIRGIAHSSTLGFAEVKTKAKGSGPDISDILKSLTAGQPPSF